MSKYKDKVRAEFHGNSWFFIHDELGKVKFDQALIDATRVGPGVVEGYARAVHGLDLGTAPRMKGFGVTGAHQLGAYPGTSTPFGRIRLNEDGTTEPAGQHG